MTVRFSFYGHMVCFLNCHLAAHMNYALQRVDEIEYILETQDLDLSDTPHVRDHKSVVHTDKASQSHTPKYTSCNGLKKEQKKLHPCLTGRCSGLAT